MDLEFGTVLLQTWYDSWLVVVGFGAALLLTVVVVGRGNWQTTGLLLKTVMVAATVAASLLALKRPTLPIGCDPDGLRFLLLIGVIVSLVVALPYLYFSLREAQPPAHPSPA